MINQESLLLHSLSSEEFRRKQKEKVNNRLLVSFSSLCLLKRKKQNIIWTRELTIAGDKNTSMVFFYYVFH